MHRLSGVPGAARRRARSALRLQGQGRRRARRSPTRSASATSSKAASAAGRPSCASTPRSSTARPAPTAGRTPTNRPATSCAIEDDIGTQVLAALERVLGIDAQAAPCASRASATSPPTTSTCRALSLPAPAEEPRARSTPPRSCSGARSRRTRTSRARRRGSARRASSATCSSGAPAHVALAEEACAQAQALDATAYEVHEAVGSLRARRPATPRKPRAAYRRALAIVPSPRRADRARRGARRRRNRPLEAERDARSARSRRSRATRRRTSSTAASCSSRARPATRSSPASAPPMPRARQPERVQQPRRRLPVSPATSSRRPRRCRAPLAIEPRRASYSNIGTGLYYQRPVRRGGRRCSARRIELAPADHRLWGNLADALLFDGNADGARRVDLPPAPWNWRRGSSPSTRSMAINQAQTAYYAISGSGAGDRARQCIENALAEGETRQMKCTTTSRWHELGLGDQEQTPTSRASARASWAIPKRS